MIQDMSGPKVFAEQGEAMKKTVNGATKGERTRSNIVAKAAVIFNQRGYDGSSMQDIVEAVGLEKGSIYGHFASKEALALEAFDFAWADTERKRMANLDAASNAVDKIAIHIRNYIRTPSFLGGCPLLNTAVDADDGNPALRDRARRAYRSWASALTHILTEGQVQGDVRAEIRPHSIANYLIAALEGATAVSRLDKRSGALADVEEVLVHYLDAEVRARA
jgi:TetR/AcrR family transcriptional repressor of nem operon